MPPNSFQGPRKPKSLMLDYLAAGWVSRSVGALTRWTSTLKTSHGLEKVDGFIQPKALGVSAAQHRLPIPSWVVVVSQNARWTNVSLWSRTWTRAGITWTGQYRGQQHPTLGSMSVNLQAPSAGNASDVLDINEDCCVSFASHLPLCKAGLSSGQTLS